jgi:hypothetical protein
VAISSVPHDLLGHLFPDLLVGKRTIARVTREVKDIATVVIPRPRHDTVAAALWADQLDLLAHCRTSSEGKGEVGFGFATLPGYDAIKKGASRSRRPTTLPWVILGLIILGSAAFLILFLFKAVGEFLGMLTDMFVGGCRKYPSCCRVHCGDDDQPLRDCSLSPHPHRDCDTNRPKAKYVLSQWHTNQRALSFHDNSADIGFAPGALPQASSCPQLLEFVHQDDQFTPSTIQEARDNSRIGLQS